MPTFITGHAAHPDAATALALAAAQVEASRASRSPAFEPTLGLLYITDHYAAQAEILLADARLRWPGAHWAGSVGIGVLAGGTEHFDQPALALMLGDLPADSFSVFNGRQPLDSRVAHSALVHADPTTADLDELIHELAERTHSGYLFGGLGASRGRQLHIADGVFEGGLSGLSFAPGVALLSRVTQGCQPLGRSRRITAAERNLVLALDDEPALPLLLAAVGVSLDQPRQAMAALRGTLVGLTDGDDAALARPGQFGVDTRVRHLIGIDPSRQGVAIAERAETGQQLAFCRRDVDAARRDLVRICAEIREELDAPMPEPPGADVAADERETGGRIAGAIYVSCSGRGGPHFGAPSAEAQILQHALGDVPLVGFFAGGEIGHHHLYGYTGVLTVFAAD